MFVAAVAGEIAMGRWLTQFMPHPGLIAMLCFAPAIVVLFIFGMLIGATVWLLLMKRFVHQNTLLFHQGLARSGPTLAEHLKIHALARILLAGSINNIQVSWVKLNRKLSQLCLQAGANDYGGTLMEENISREAGATAGQYTSPEDFQAFILETGRIPAERNTTYSRLHIKMPIATPTSEQAMTPEFA